MVIIDTSTQSISITRGDYAALTFCAYEDDGITLYELNQGDTVQLQVAKKYGADEDDALTLTRTKINSAATTDDDYTIEVESDDTKGLKFGDYYYDVSIITADGDVITYIGDTGTNQPKFTILKEVGARTE